jgi:hypothetical protein
LRHYTLVNPIIGEMSSWQLELRTKAAVLLRTMLVYLEENATQHVQQLCLAFVSASRDANVGAQVGPARHCLPRLRHAFGTLAS